MTSESLTCPRCGSLISTPARFCPSCGHATARLTPGQTLDGKYEILEKLAEGGMGEVYKARHLHLDEIRIIKVTKPDALGEGRDPRRFQEEARMATLVRHPNVAALYDFSRLLDGSYYMVWEFIDGVTLEQWLRSHGPLPPGQALDIARQVLAGLSEIHAQGIVHRDLSPDNILVRPGRDGSLNAKIIDLGIAKRVAAESLSMTGTGLFVGKLKYCSPEQAGALARGESLDGRSDLYSFGVILYEMLTGRPPFEEQTPEAYLGKHLHAAPPPLDAASLSAGVGPSLSAIVSKALEKQRDRRFASARDLADALERVRPALQESGAGARTLALPEEKRAYGSLFALAAVAVGALAVAAAFWILGRPTAAHPPAAAPESAVASPTSPPLPAPTAGPDQVVVAPRIVELATPRAAPPPTEAPTPPPPRRVEPTRAPTSAAAPPPEPSPAPPAEKVEPPMGGVLTEQKLRNFFRFWRTRPPERRARRSMEVASLANFWIATHPGDPFSGELKQTLPETLRSETEQALEEGKPGLARLFHKAYRQFRFSPPDPALAQRVRQAVARTPGLESPQ